MRPLILILLGVVVLEAQAPQTPGTTPPSKLAEFARTERERRAQTPGTEGRVYTSEVVRRGTSSPLAISSAAPAPSAGVAPRRDNNVIAAPAQAPKALVPVPAPAAPAAPAAVPVPFGIRPLATNTPAVAPTPPGPDANKEWEEKVNTQRTKVRELADRYASLQIQVSEYTDQFFAPVTDANSQQAAMNKLGDAQRKMDDTGRELAEAQSKLREMEIQGPPRR